MLKAVGERVGSYGRIVGEQALPGTKTDDFPADSKVAERALSYGFGGSAARAFSAWGKVFTAITFTSFA